VPVAPTRLLLIRAGVVFGTAAVLLVELLSAVGMLNRPTVIVLWALAAVAVGYLGRRRFTRPRIRELWAGADRLERAVAVVLGGLFLADLAVALLAPPNNFDSQTYHLPKVEHWVAQGGVGFYPTVIDRQLAMAPGA